MSVKRWVIRNGNRGPDMYEDDDFGDFGPNYVLASDYDALAAERDRLARENANLLERLSAGREREVRLAEAEERIMLARAMLDAGKPHKAAFFLRSVKPDDVATDSATCASSATATK